jgi:predicted ester cyclase
MPRTFLSSSFSCYRLQPNTQRGGFMAESKQIANYRLVIDEAFSKGNLDVIDRVIAPNIIEHEKGVEPATRDGLKDAIRMLRTAFPDLRMTVDDVWEIGDKVIGRCHYTGTHRGPLGDIAPTGKQIDFEGIDIVRFVGDKCVEHWGINDRMTMMEQLGVVPEMH